MPPPPPPPPRSTPQLLQHPQQSAVSLQHQQHQQSLQQQQQHSVVSLQHQQHQQSLQQHSQQSAVSLQHQQHQQYLMQPPALLQHGVQQPRAMPPAGGGAGAMFGSFDDDMLEEISKAGPQQARQAPYVEQEPGRPKPWRPGKCGLGVDAVLPVTGARGSWANPGAPLIPGPSAPMSACYSCVPYCTSADYLLALPSSSQLRASRPFYSSTRSRLHNRSRRRRRKEEPRARKGG